MTKARLLLEDGTEFAGESFGFPMDGIGEVVFNTSLTGYQEIATDPFYRFQIVIMTYAHIGNYGTEESALQSDIPQVAGFVVRDLFGHPSKPGAEVSLADYFMENNIPASRESTHAP